MPSDRTLDRLLEEAFDALDEGEPESAIELAQMVLKEDPSDPDAFVIIGAAEFERLHLKEARASLAMALEISPEHPDAHWWLGLIEERAGNELAATRHFREATRLDKKTYPAPFALKEKEFRAEVEKAIKKLPSDFRAQLENLAIVVEPLPGDELLDGDPPLPPTILGLHIGVPRPERANAVGAGPNTIFLFQKNLERAALTRAGLIEQIEVTLLHEIGHYLGLDEDDVEERGLE